MLGRVSCCLPVSEEERWLSAGRAPALKEALLFSTWSVLLVMPCARGQCSPSTHISHTPASGTPYCLNWIRRKKSQNPRKSEPDSLYLALSFAIFFPGCVMYQEADYAAAGGFACVKPVVKTRGYSSLRTWPGQEIALWVREHLRSLCTGEGFVPWSVPDPGAQGMEESRPHSAHLN